MWQIWCISFPVFLWLTQIFWKVEWEQCSMFSDPSNHSLGVVECTQGYEFHFHQVMMMMMIVTMMGIFTPTRLIGLYNVPALLPQQLALKIFDRNMFGLQSNLAAEKLWWLSSEDEGSHWKRIIKIGIPSQTTERPSHLRLLNYHFWHIVGFFPVENWVVLLLL